MTSLPVLGADGVHLGSGLRVHPSLRRVVLNIQHGPYSPLHSSVKQLFISQTIDLDIILQNICVPSQSAAHLQSSAREPEKPSAVYSTTSDTDALHGMFFSPQHFVVFFTRNAILIIFRVSAYISYEIFPWFLLFKVSFNEVK